MNTDQTKNRTFPYFIFVIAFFVLFLSPLVITCNRMFSHDTIWFYGVFHYFAESLSNGIFPFWDPFDYSGQPFYTNLSIMHLANPITLAVIFLNKILNMSLVTLYHWNFVISIITASLGVYFFIREVTKHAFTRVMSLFIFLFSSFTFICLRQAGFLYSFLWLPWAMLFLVRLIKRKGLMNVIGFAFFMGLAMGGYQGLYVLVFAGVFIVSLFINKRDFIMEAVKANRRMHIATFLIIFLLLSAPLISVFLDKNDFVPMARQMTSAAATDSYTNDTGCVPGEINDLRGLIDRDTAVKGYFDKKFPLSEGFLHIGFMALLFALTGLIFSKNEFRLNFVITLVFVVLVFMGDKCFMQKFVNAVFPPFKFVRHMQLFAGFIIFNLIYFAAQGIDVIVDALALNRARRKILLALSFLIFADMMIYARQALPHVTMDRPLMKFSEYPELVKYSHTRSPRMVTSDYIRYFRPLLYKKHTAYNAATISKEYLHPNLYNDLFKLYYNISREKGYGLSLACHEKTMKELFGYGVSSFLTWDTDDRMVFLDILNIVILDVLKNKDFYAVFDGLWEDMLELRSFVIAGYKDAMKGADWQFKDKALSCLGRFTGLQYKLKTEAENRLFVFAGKKYDLKRRAALHLTLYSNMTAADYLDYVWGSSHVEEFTLLLTRDYRDMLDAPMKAPGKTEKKNAVSNIEKAMGIDRDIVSFYTKAVYLDKENTIKALMAPDAFGDTLFIDGRGTPFRGAGANVFKYGVYRYDTDTLELEYSSLNDGFLFYSDGYSKYWKSYIDGKRVHLYKADLAFKAIKAPKGVHRVVFKYDPWTFKTALLLYYAAFAACAALLLFLSWKNRTR